MDRVIGITPAEAAGLSVVGRSKACVVDCPDCAVSAKSKRERREATLGAGLAELSLEILGGFGAGAGGAGRLMGLGETGAEAVVGDGWRDSAAETGTDSEVVLLVGAIGI